MLQSDILKHALIAWRKARGDALFPSVTEFGPFQMRPFLKNVGIVRKEPDGVYRISLVGTWLVDEISHDPTGRELRDLYPPEEREHFAEIYEFVFGHHYIGYTQRVFSRQSGVKFLIEQLVLPVGNADGIHDRYVFIADKIPMPLSDTNAANQEMQLGVLQTRTIYSPETFLPVECFINTPRPAEEMQVRLTDFTPPGSIMRHQRA